MGLHTEMTRLPEAQCWMWDISFCVVCQGRVPGTCPPILQDTAPILSCPLELARKTLAEDSMHFAHRRNQAGTGLEVSSLLASLCSARKCSAGCSERSQ